MPVGGVTSSIDPPADLVRCRGSHPTGATGRAGGGPDCRGETDRPISAIALDRGHLSGPRPADDHGLLPRLGRLRGWRGCGLRWKRASHLDTIFTVRVVDGAMAPRRRGGRSRKRSRNAWPVARRRAWSLGGRPRPIWKSTALRVATADPRPRGLVHVSRGPGRAWTSSMNVARYGVRALVCRRLPGSAWGPGRRNITRDGAVSGGPAAPCGWCEGAEASCPWPRAMIGSPLESVRAPVFCLDGAIRPGGPPEPESSGLKDDQLLAVRDSCAGNSDALEVVPPRLRTRTL